MTIFKSTLIGVALLVGASLAPVQAAPAISTTPTPGFTLDQPRQWRHASRESLRQRAERKRVVTTSDSKIGPVNSFGSLYTPSGIEWIYTAEIIGDDITGYTGAKMTIYDENNQVCGTINTTFELAEHETMVNLVQINPNITKKFFNVDDKYEVILFIHATTDDYAGHIYQLIYQIAPDQSEPLARIEGNQILARDFAADEWSEKFQMVMMREEILDDEGEFNIYFDIYGHADYSSLKAPRLLHTFKCDYSLMSEMGNNGAPVALQNVGGKPMFMIASYEKPYFDPESDWFDPRPAADNNLLIKVYDCSKLSGVDTEALAEYEVKIPIETKEDYAYSFPTIGAFSGNDDFSVGLFGEDPAEPYFIVTTENYRMANDDFIDDFNVYNRAGELVATIAEEVEGYMQLMPLPGHNDQYCFYNTEASDSYWIVELPACEEVARIPFQLDGLYFSTAIDRVPAGTGYQYAIARTQGVELPDGDIIHSIGYFNADGAFDHFDDINLGSEVMMAQVAIVGEWLNPYLFNTDSEREYMFIVKVPYADKPEKMEERLWVRNAAGKNMLDFGSDPELGGTLTSVMIQNATGTHPMLVNVYGDRDYDTHMDKYTLNFNSLPLSRFEAGGDGTIDNPYIITTPGDMMQINAFPAAHYRLGGDIDFAGERWTGVTESFSGTLDGCNHVILGLNIDGPGIFSDLAGAGVVKDLVLYKPSITPSGTAAGFVAGTTIYNGVDAPVIENVHIYQGSARSEAYDNEFGGIVGNHTTGSIVKACSINDTHINLPKATAGGIVGSISTSGADVKAAAFSGAIDANVAGGIVGAASSGNIKDCHAHGSTPTELRGSGAVGGIVGYVGTYMEARPLVANCMFAGTLTSTNPKSANLGGIAGEVEGGNNIAITNCVAQVAAIHTADGAKSTAHRIAGATCADSLGEIDWESPLWEEEPDLYNRPQDWPRLPVEPDNGLINNYASDVEGFAVVDSALATEGVTIKAKDLTQQFLEAQDWKFGDVVDEPWSSEANDIHLYYERATRGLYIDRENVTAEVGDEIELRLTVIGGHADLAVESTDPSVLEVDQPDLSVEAGAPVIVVVKVVGEGTADIVATCSGLSARCTIDAKASGVAAIAAAVSPLAYLGTIVTAPGQISVYNLAGVKVASGYGSVNVAQLPAGAYIAVSGASTLKLIR